MFIQSMGRVLRKDKLNKKIWISYGFKSKKHNRNM